MTKLLLVSNDSSVEKQIGVSLKHNGFIIHCTSFAEEAMKYLKEIRFDLVMIDVHLLDGSGHGLFQRLRQSGMTLPILMLGECEFDEFMLRDSVGKETNYMIKPFKFRELRKKVNTLLSHRSPADAMVTFGELKIDVRQQLVMVKDQIVKMGKTELRILMLLARKTGDVVEMTRIKSLLEGEGSLYNMTTYFYISKLRNKLKQLAGDTLDIMMINDQGYQLIYKA